MANKLITVYSCSNCGAQFPKWSGRCLDCGKWGTLQMQAIDEKKSAQKELNLPPARIEMLDQLADEELARIRTGIGEIDRVLGNGITPGSLILLSGEPGIGKSTIVAQIAESLKGGRGVIYASGEESAPQIKSRFKRLSISGGHIGFMNETNIEKIANAIEANKPDLAIIDSIQTMYSSFIESEAGSPAQIRACAARLLETAKQGNVAIIMIGHITKDGSIAGPKSLEHIVDTVIYLEAEKRSEMRVLRAIKNRFGSVNELGIFIMGEKGFSEVKNPASIFLDIAEPDISGSVISAVMEGTRPFLIEIQALTAKTAFGYPQRRTSGFDANRLSILLAVLSKKAKINLISQDVIVNVIGGLRVNDPGIDLAIIYAIVSSLLDRPFPRDTIVLGEVGLGGELRNIKQLKERLKEAHKLGYTKAVIPPLDIKLKGLEIIKVKRLEEAINFLKKG